MMKIKKEESITDNEVKIMLGFLVFLVLVILVVFVPMVYLMSRPVSIVADCDVTLDGSASFNSTKDFYFHMLHDSSLAPVFTKAEFNHTNLNCGIKGEIPTYVFQELRK